MFPLFITSGRQESEQLGDLAGSTPTAAPELLLSVGPLVGGGGAVGNNRLRTWSHSSGCE